MASSDNSTTGDNDVLGNSYVGGQGDDYLYGGAGDDFLDGGAGDDTLLGSNGNDTFSCNDGKDYVFDLGNGTDVLNVNCWGSVVARLAGNWFSDIWSNNDGKAILIANGFNVDVSLAEGTQGWTITNEINDGNVSFIGSILNDTLAGGLGDDTLTGGEGADIFFFYNWYQSWGHDTITDFVSGNDKLHLNSWGLQQIDGHAFKYDGADSVITMTDGSTITVQNVHVQDSDFLFS
jgi:Ca2+-binding RTX toxin-like protein